MAANRGHGALLEGGAQGSTRYAASVSAKSAESLEERRERRRRATWGIARSHQELEDIDLEFWQAATVGERFEAVAAMGEEAAAIARDDESSVGFQGAPFGVRRRGS
jgi:hypothetical protein